MKKFFVTSLGCLLLVGLAAASGDAIRSATQSFDEIKDASRVAAKALAEARASGDQKRIKCVQAGILSITVQVAVAASALKAAQMYVGADEVKLLQLQVRKVTAALAKVKEFSAEVDSCSKAPSPAAPVPKP